MKSDLTVIIPTLTADLRLLNLALQLRSQKNIVIEIILILNPPNNDWPVEFKTISELKLLKSELGVNHARNAGLKIATSDYIFFLDSDCELTDDLFLFRYLSALKKRPDLTALGSHYIIPAGMNQVSRAYNFIQNLWLYKGIYSEDYLTDHLIGGNILFNHTLIKNLKFDDSFIFGSSEYELLLRLSKAGHLFAFDSALPVIHTQKLKLKDLIYKAQMQSLGFKKIKSQYTQFPKRQKTFLNWPNPDAELIHYIDIYYENFFKCV